MTIARTELAFAASEGQEEIWSDASKQQAIDLTTMSRKWIATPGGKPTCRICQHLASLAPIPFEKSFAYGGFKGQHPPAHPNCRCTVGLVRTKKPKPKV